MRSGKISPTRFGFTLIEVMCVVLVIALLLAMAIPNYIHSREASRSRACSQNLREFEAAKEQWAIVTHAAATAIPQESDLVPDYLKGTDSSLPKCPAGGGYLLNDLGHLPTCNIADNGTAEKWDDHSIE